MDKYVYDGEMEKLTVDDLKQFVTDFTDGKLAPHRKSEPIPEDNSGHVKEVVGLSFDEFVVDAKDKDVLVIFYNPGCGHC